MDEEVEATAKSTKKLDWGASAAKQLMAQDMMDDLVPVWSEIQDKKKLYDDMYRGTPEFEDWP